MNWHGKRYYSFDSFLKNYFGKKIYKVSLDGGFTCPNRDGTLGTGGCIFCSEGGSGDFASSAALSVTDQITAGIEMVSRKIENGKYIAYFQAFTNTYGPIEKLEALYMEAVNNPRIVALAIGTRPDCLPAEVLKLLNQLNKIKPVFVELGLQTIHEETASFIRRGYPLSCFDEAVMNLHKIGVLTVVCRCIYLFSSFIITKILTKMIRSDMLWTIVGAIVIGVATTIYWLIKIDDISETAPNEDQTYESDKNDEIEPHEEASVETVNSVPEEHTNI